MSVEQEIDAIIKNAQGVQETQVVNKLALTVEEVKNLLEATDDSLLKVCDRIESASTKQGLMKALQQFDRVKRFFLEVAKDSEHEHFVVQAVCTLTVSPCFQGMLESTSSLQEAITDYKTAVARDLAATMRERRELANVDKEVNDQLISQFLPDPDESARVNEGEIPSVSISGSKRGVSSVVQDSDFTRIPKKRSLIPALAPLHQVPGGWW